MSQTCTSKLTAGLIVAILFSSIILLARVPAYSFKKPGEREIYIQTSVPYIIVNGNERGHPFYYWLNSEPPVMADSILYAPMEDLIWIMHGEMAYLSEKKVRISLRNNTIEAAWPDPGPERLNTWTVNGLRTINDVPPRIVLGRIMFPVQYFLENLGCMVDVDANDESALISFDKNLDFNFQPEGFGKNTRGALAQDGVEPVILYVTSLEDNPSKPLPGTLRWAVAQEGPRVVRFKVAGTIALKGNISIDNSFLTIDGYSAPGDGITIKNYALVINGRISQKSLDQYTAGQVLNPLVREVVIRYIRFRVGDQQVRGTYPTGGGGLDCISISGYAENILVDHCSFSWSCDELLGILTGKNITFQWCLFSEPLGDISDTSKKTPIANRIHPYGNDHAYGANVSGATFSVHHSLFAHSRIRGPQFEANDAHQNQGFQVKMESVNNVIFDYGGGAGSRYKIGIDPTQGTDEKQAGNITYSFHFVGNRFINRTSSQPDIHAETRYGDLPFIYGLDKVKTYVFGNIGPSRPTDDLDQWASVKIRKIVSSGTAYSIRETRKEEEAAGKLVLTQHMSDIPLFESTITSQKADQAYNLVLRFAGAGKRRDEVDRRIMEEIANRKFYTAGLFAPKGKFAIEFPWSDYPNAKITYDALAASGKPLDVLPFNPNPGKNMGFTLSDFFTTANNPTSQGYVTASSFVIGYPDSSPEYFLRSQVQVGGWPVLRTGKSDLVKLGIIGRVSYPLFDPGINKYTVEVFSDVFESRDGVIHARVDLLLAAAESEAVLSVNEIPVLSGKVPSPIPLLKGNVIQVLVKGTDKTEQTYTLTLVPVEKSAVRVAR